MSIKDFIIMAISIFQIFKKIFIDPLISYSGYFAKLMLKTTVITILSRILVKITYTGGKYW